MSSEDRIRQTTFADHAEKKTRQKAAIAIDIETINLTPDPDFRDPSQWEPFAVALAHRDSTGEVESNVITKDSRNPCAELALYENVVAWIKDRESELLITYNGSSYDIPILQHRAWHELRECPDKLGVAVRLDDLIHDLDHRDLLDVIRRERGYRLPLEEALEVHGIDFTAPRYDDELVTGSDMPDWGRQITHPETPEEKRSELVTVIHSYASSDVVPLFELDAALRES